MSQQVSNPLPPNIRILDVTSHSMKFQLTKQSNDPCNLPIKEFKIYVRRHNANAWIDMLVTPYEESYHPYTFGLMRPNTKYDIKAAIFNGCRWSPWSKIINHTSSVV